MKHRLNLRPVVQKSSQTGRGFGRSTDARPRNRGNAVREPLHRPAKAGPRNPPPAASRNAPYRRETGFTTRAPAITSPPPQKDFVRLETIRSAQGVMSTFTGVAMVSSTTRKGTVRDWLRDEARRSEAAYNALMASTENTRDEKVVARAPDRRRVRAFPPGSPAGPPGGLILKAGIAPFHPKALAVASVGTTSLFRFRMMSVFDVSTHGTDPWGLQPRFRHRTKNAAIQMNVCNREPVRISGSTEMGALQPDCSLARVGRRTNPLRGIGAGGEIAAGRRPSGLD